MPPKINDQENLADNGSTTNSIRLSSDDEDVSDKLIQSSIRMNNDIVKFISKREKYSQELCEKLESVNAEVLLVPNKSLIKFTKKTGLQNIKDWEKRCSSIIREFCGRFGKSCLKVKGLSRVRKDLPKLGDILRWSSAAYWIDNNKKLAVMTEQSEREQVLKEVEEFLQKSENDGKDSYKYNYGDNGTVISSYLRRTIVLLNNNYWMRLSVISRFIQTEITALGR